MYCYLAFKLSYLTNLNLFSIRIKELLELIVLRKKGDGFLFFAFVFVIFKAFFKAWHGIIDSVSLNARLIFFLSLPTSQRSIEDELTRSSQADILTIAISYLAIFGYIAIALGEFSKCERILVSHSEYYIKAPKHAKWIKTFLSTKHSRWSTVKKLRAKTNGCCFCCGHYLF